ncbi:hypothetical protein [Brevundimonas diminuta]|uniref:Uncharacterized protein n=1 Tax=Brevundimonas diminuta TaxID=293 RepID=A0A410NVH0_BREDI|nr:hypothetical protein [Brevundimonas diminuta]QAT13868.1 hypothetical protein EQG53_05555 [Brevundimonas diminuta]QQB88767.1 hypothetical protein I6H83_16870 [Brevundimonas diminuta]
MIGRLHRMGCVRTEAEKLEVWSRRSAEVAGFKAPRVKAPAIPKAKKGKYPRVKPETTDRAKGLPVAEKQTAVRLSGGPVAYVESGAGVDSPNARPFQDRRLGQCAWPLGERAAISCCNPVAGGEGFGSSYCRGHLKALLSPFQPKAAKPSDYVRSGASKTAAPRSAWDSGRIAA